MFQTMEPNTDPTAEQVASEPLLQLFNHSHLRDPLRGISRQFCALAISLVQAVPRNAQRTIMLHRLRESKDHAVTAVLWKDPPKSAPPSQGSCSAGPTDAVGGGGR